MSRARGREPARSNQLNTQFTLLFAHKEGEMNTTRRIYRIISMLIILALLLQAFPVRAKDPVRRAQDQPG